MLPSARRRRSCSSGGAEESYAVNGSSARSHRPSSRRSAFRSEEFPDPLSGRAAAAVLVPIVGCVLSCSGNIIISPEYGEE